MDLPEQRDVWVTSRQGDPHLAYRDANQRTDLQQLEPNGAALGLGQLRSRQSQPSQHLQQHISDRREVQAQLACRPARPSGQDGSRLQSTCWICAQLVAWMPGVPIGTTDLPARGRMTPRPAMEY